MAREWIQIIKTEVNRAGDLRLWYGTDDLDFYVVGYQSDLKAGMWMRRSKRGKALEFRDEVAE